MKNKPLRGRARWNRKAWAPYARELYEAALAMIDGSYYRDDGFEPADQNPSSRDPAFWE